MHRLVRLSPFDSAHRRHTSFAQVIVSPLLADDETAEIDESDLRIDTYRASGAGGQHVNKTDSAVRISSPAHGDRRPVPERALADLEQADRAAHPRSRLAEVEQEQREAELAKERGAVQEADFGSQIRSYVLHPYQIVKDHRTDLEAGNTQGVLDGDQTSSSMRICSPARREGEVAVDSATLGTSRPVRLRGEAAPTGDAALASQSVQEPDFQTQTDVALAEHDDARQVTSAGSMIVFESVTMVYPPMWSRCATSRS